MPNKSIPTLGDSNWGTPLNAHLSQLQNPTTGGINSFEQFSLRPTNLTTDDIGKTYLYTQTGNIHQWNGNSWKVLNESVINVKDYGAVGDGVVDDTAAIQSSFTQLGSLQVNIGQKSLVIHFPSGSYILKSQISLNNYLPNLYTPVLIKGDGSNCTAIQGVNTDLFKLYGNFYSLHGLSLGCNTIDINIGLDVKGGWHSYEDITFGPNFKNCFKITELLNSTFDKIKANGDEFKPSIGEVFRVNASVNNTVSNSYFNAYGKGFNFGGTPGPGRNWCEGWSINNTIIKLAQYAVYADIILYLSILGCVFDFNIKSAVKLLNGGSIKLSNNWFAGPPAGFTDGFSLVEMNDISFDWDCCITSNTFYIDDTYVASKSLNIANQRPKACTFVTGNIFSCPDSGVVLGNSSINSNFSKGKEIFDDQSNTVLKTFATLQSDTTARFIIQKKIQNGTFDSSWNIETGFGGNNNLSIVDLKNGASKIEIGQAQKAVAFPSGKIVVGTLRQTTSSLTVDGLAEFTDNATAIAAGLTKGETYRTGDLLKIVH